MTAFHPMPPLKAIHSVEAAGLPHAARIIRDYAAAGLVKSYAAAIETWEVAGPKTTLRGATIPPDIWQRMIRDGADEDAWTGGTVRLAGSDLVGGAPTVHVTGIGFNAADLTRMINQQTGSSVNTTPALPATTNMTTDPIDVSAPRPTARPFARGIKPGALVATVAETMAALSCGKTTVYKLLSDGKLKRAPDGAGTGTRIDVASIKALVRVVG